MPLNSFAPFVKINGCFIIRNISDPKKTVSIFNTPTGWGKERDILSLPGVSEGDIRSSLLKGEIRNKLINNEITIVCSDIDLLQFNADQKLFLQNSGIVNGLQVGADELGIAHYEDIELIGVVDDSNTVFTIPEGVFFYDLTHKIIVYRNGIKQHFLDDFYIAESNGPGTGYNTVIFSTPPAALPLPVDVITADYYVSNV